MLAFAKFCKKYKTTQSACVFDCFDIIVNIYTLSAPQSRDEETQESSADGSLLRTVPRNVVQSIRAFRVTDLQSEAMRLGQHFLYAHCAQAVTRQQVLAAIAESFQVPKQVGKNYDALSECLTSMFHKASDQPGFLVVLEQLPNTPKFDKEARENLLDVFRDAADYWSEKKIAFRVFYSFQ